MLDCVPRRNGFQTHLVDVNGRSLGGPPRRQELALSYGDGAASRLTPRPGLASLGRLFLAFGLLRCPGSVKQPLRQIAERFFAEFAGRSARAFLPAVAVVAKQPRHRVAAAKKMDLKAMCLFLGASLRIDAPDVLFGIGIRSLFHVLHSK